ncbi:hypothetical protein M378DRAFT_170763 [Amanita muscaria Koide BX008]|uniref:Uncharacterized protein n=1 Tax=Amanita muscaria (strain Koide BX008) TaxID=946122 RepID=A0A0C2WAP6_AMAMK|nr:hypothetical protein M378DRAFT_170763 [Amanita muscaria Koide BX008]
MPQNFLGVFPTTQHQASEPPSVKVEEPHGTASASPTPGSTNIPPLPFAMHVPETGGPDIANPTEGSTAQIIQAQLLETAQANNRSLLARVDLLTNRLEEETRRADQAERVADETQGQLEALRSESGHRNKRYCSPRHHD